MGPASFLCLPLGSGWGLRKRIFLNHHCTGDHIMQTLASGIKKHQKVPETEGKKIQKLGNEPACGGAKTDGLTFRADHPDAHGAFSNGCAAGTALQQSKVEPGHQEGYKYGRDDQNYGINQSCNQPFAKRCVHKLLGLKLGLIKNCHVIGYMRAKDLTFLAIHPNLFR